MKILKVLAFAATAILSISSVNAQDITDDYTRIYAGFNGRGFYDVENSYLNGFMIGGEYNLNVTNHQKPLFLGFGLEYVYNTYTYEVGIESTTTIHALSIPINVSYKFGNEKFQVSPFVGQSLRFGLSHKVKTGGKELNIYDDVVDNDNDNKANRCQLMLNAGLTFFFHKFSLSYRYQISEIKLTSKSNADYSNSLTLGYSF